MMRGLFVTTTEAPAATPATNPREAMAIRSLATVAFALNLNTNVLGALLPFVRADLAADDGHVWWMVSGAPAGSALGALLVTPIAARLGRRGAMVGGMLVFLVASLLHLVPAGPTWLVAARVLSGLAVGVAYAAASALVAEIVPYARRGSAMGRFTAGMFLAVPIGMPLAVWLAREVHWSTLFAFQAVVAAAGTWWALRAVPDVRHEEPRRALLAPLGSGAVVAGLIATMLHVGSFFTTVQLATSWLDQTGRVRKEDQILLWVAFGAASVLGSSMLGRVSDAIGKRNFVLTTSALLAGCFVLMAREPGGVLLASLAGALAVIAAARTGPLQALVSGLVPPAQLSGLMGLRSCAMQVGVVAFALGARELPAELGFRGVLMLAAGCQAASYLAIRLFVREGK